MKRKRPTLLLIYPTAWYECVLWCLDAFAQNLVFFFFFPGSYAFRCHELLQCSDLVFVMCFVRFRCQVQRNLLSEQHAEVVVEQLHDIIRQLKANPAGPLNARKVHEDEVNFRSFHH
jgi:hypothetical protein